MLSLRQCLKLLALQAISQSTSGHLRHHDDDVDHLHDDDYTDDNRDFEGDDNDDDDDEDDDDDDDDDDGDEVTVGW